MKNEISRELLNKYMRGETTPAESVLIDKWYTSFDKENEDSGTLDSFDNVEVEKRILAKVKERINSGTLPIKRKSPRFHLTSLKWAAAVTLLAVAGTGTFLYWQSSHRALETLAQTHEQGIKKIANNTSLISHQVLSDGSVVLLQPNSSIEFPAIFSEVKREVRLTGEAFFDVAKNKARPFIITTGDVTIKVLGTSFNVKAYENEDQITVAVKTGRVLVSKSEGSPHINNGAKEEIILTPNQEVVYSTLEENFLKKLVDEPAIILSKPTLFEMKYDGTPVVKIFEVLEQNYGIDIVFDEEILAGCSLTTSMNEEGLYERIEIICKAINAQYKITDSMIAIKSNGCQ